MRAAGVLIHESILLRNPQALRIDRDRRKR